MKLVSTVKNTLKGNLPIFCLVLMLFGFQNKEHAFAGRTSVVASDMPYAPANDTDCVTAIALHIGGPGRNPITVKVVSDPLSSNGSQTQTCLISATNVGSAAVPGVKIRIQIPSGKTMVTTQVGQGSYDENSGIWTVDKLEKGGNSTMTMTLKAE